MRTRYRETIAEVSARALKENWLSFRKVLPAELGMMAVVKANAYGHDALIAAGVAAEVGADYLGVAFLDEALALREAGVELPILVMGYTPSEGIDIAIEHNITLTVYSEELLQAIIEKSAVDATEAPTKQTAKSAVDATEAPTKQTAKSAVDVAKAPTTEQTEKSAVEAVAKPAEHMEKSAENAAVKSAELAVKPAAEHADAEPRHSVRRERSRSTAAPLKVHVKVDTGMARIGVYGVKPAIDYILKLSQIPHVYIEGIFTHYACADAADPTTTQKQHQQFQQILEAVQAAGVSPLWKHAANSAAALDKPQYAGNMVRLGISWYGLQATDEFQHHHVPLRPVLSFATTIVQVKAVPKGTAVSYGGTFTTMRETTILATLPVGYADGLNRRLSNCGEVLVRGMRVPIVGRVCMDQVVVDVTDVAGAAVGDQAVLIGRQGGEEIVAAEWSERLGTIDYEITCAISSRVPRVIVET